MTHAIPKRSTFVLALLLWAGAARAQEPVHAAPPDTAAGDGMAGMHHHDMAGMDMSGMDMHDMHDMHGMYGPYTLTREASGTAWQPDMAGHHGLHVMRGEWMLMLHGLADVVQDRQGGPRGGDKLVSANMLMGMAQRPLGAATLGLRAMLSAEPATIGKAGYPLLLQTGETADGRTPLVDRQHPHDLFMELATSLSISRGERSAFLYAGLPGEPALGPPAFMHRFSASNLPSAPITHHWLDSTHITFGVLTAGVVSGPVKVEASAFRGREPDENRWNIEAPKLDSWSYRLSYNPTPSWAFQVSHGRLESPEQLEPDVNQERTTASAMYAGVWRDQPWAATLVWGRDRNDPGRSLDAYGAEMAATLRETHTVFARLERVEKDELFVAPDPRAGRVFDVGRVEAGYRYDVWRGEHVTTGIGVTGSLAFAAGDARSAYGDHPASGLAFLRVALR